MVHIILTFPFFCTCEWFVILNFDYCCITIFAYFIALSLRLNEHCMILIFLNGVWFKSYKITTCSVKSLSKENLYETETIIFSWSDLFKCYGFSFFSPFFETLSSYKKFDKFFYLKFLFINYVKLIARLLH